MFRGAVLLCIASISLVSEIDAIVKKKMVLFCTESALLFFSFFVKLT